MLDVLSSSCLHPLQNEEGQEAAAGKYRICKHTPFVGQLIRTHTFYIFMSPLGHNVARPCAAQASAFTHKNTSTLTNTHICLAPTVLQVNS